MYHLKAKTQLTIKVQRKFFMTYLHVLHPFEFENKLDQLFLIQ